MKLTMQTAGALVVLALGGYATQAAEPDRLLGHFRSDVEAAFPSLPADQLNLLVFRIPTFPQMMAAAEPVSADAVDPYSNLSLTRAQLAAKFPAMPSSEIDRLAVYLDLIEIRNQGH